jgi:chorismate mutase
MATYNNRVSNIYSGGTNEGRPSIERDSESKQIARALGSFDKSFAKFSQAYGEEKKEKAQTVFARLENDGITDPKEIKKLIDKNDPRVADLQNQWATSVIDVNFAVTHAINDANQVKKNIFEIIGDETVTGLTMADVNLDEEFGKVTRNFTDMSNSYVRAYDEAWNKVKLELQEDKLEADAKQLNLNKRSAAHTQVVDSWEKTPGKRSDMLKLWYNSKTDKKGKNFLLPEEANKTILNFLEERATTTNDVAELKEIYEIVLEKRGKKSELPSFRNDINHQEQSTRILTKLKRKVNNVKNEVNVEQMFYDGLSHKSIYKGQSVSETDKKLAEESIYKKLSLFVDEEAKKHYEEFPHHHPHQKDFDKEILLDSYVASLMSINARVFTPWKDELDKGLGVINNTNIFDIEKVEDFKIGYERFKKLKALGQDNSPTADYLSGKAEVFYEGVNTLEQVAGLDTNQAVTKMWQIINSSDQYKEFDKDPESTLSELESKFAPWFGENADVTMQVQEALRLTRIFKLTGVREDTANEKAIELVAKSYVQVDGMLWNRRNMPNGNPANAKELTKRSQFISNEVAKTTNGMYEAADLVLAPFYGNQFVVMARDTMAPIQVNGRAFAFSYADVIGNKGELATMVSKADWNQVLKERNNGILRIIEKDFEGSFSKLLMDLD